MVSLVFIWLFSSSYVLWFIWLLGCFFVCLFILFSIDYTILNNIKLSTLTHVNIWRIFVQLLSFGCCCCSCWCFFYIYFVLLFSIITIYLLIFSLKLMISELMDVDTYVFFFGKFLHFWCIFLFVCIEIEWERKRAWNGKKSALILSFFFLLKF